MPIYECERCAFRTRRKDAMSYHLGRKMPCPDQVIKVNLELMKMIREEGLHLLKAAMDSKMDLNEIIDYTTQSN